LALAEKSVRAIAFVPTIVMIASSLRSATLVLSHRSAGKSSWKIAVSCEGGVTGHGVDLDMFFFYPFLRMTILYYRSTPGAERTTFCVLIIRFNVCFFIDHHFSLRVRS